jgi:isoleucyl-tRNA synthetase
MAEDGKKMSKSLRNYTPPDELMETYGADALRLYLINSGLVRAEEQRFSDIGVKDMVRRALLPWLNAFKFLNTYARIDKWSPDEARADSDNIMDQWILSRLQSLKVNIASEMESYHLFNVVPALFEFIEDLTNWYIRLNRSRFWSEAMNQDKANAYATLYTAIYELSLSMAPFAPFLAETIYQELRSFGRTESPESVHLCTYPEADSYRIKPLLERAVTRMQHIILLGRQKRNQEKVKTKIPLSRLTVIHKDTQLLDEIGRLGDYIKSELNVKTVEYSTEEDQYITLYAKPNSPVLGKRFGKRFRDVKQKIEALDASTINSFQEAGEIEIEGETLHADDILIFREAREGSNASSDRFVSIDLDCNLNDELIREGLAREVINRIQKSRKDAGLNVVDRIRLSVYATSELLLAIDEFEAHIMKETLALNLEHSETELPLAFEIDDHRLSIAIEKVS